MMSMQVEQHRMSRVMDLVAEKLGVEAPAPIPERVEEEPEENFDDEDLERK